MWFKRNWNLFVFTPLGFLGGLVYYTVTHGHPDPARRYEEAGGFTGSGLLWAVAVLVGLIIYNRSKTKKPGAGDGAQ